MNESERVLWSLAVLVLFAWLGMDLIEISSLRKARNELQFEALSRGHAEYVDGFKWKELAE